MKWFKHYCNASKSDTLQELIDLFGKCAGEGFYWRITSYFVDKWDGKCDPSFTIRRSELCELVGMTTPKLRRGLTVMAHQSGFDWTEDERFFKIEFDKLLEIQSRDSKYTRLKRDTNAIKKRREKKREEETKKESFDASSFGPRELAKVWNELSSGSQPKIRLESFKSSSPRWKSALARLKEFPEEQYWAEVIWRIGESRFCNGDNQRGWKADFDFLLRNETHVKVLEGKYDSKVSSRTDDPDALIRMTEAAQA